MLKLINKLLPSFLYEETVGFLFLDNNYIACFICKISAEKKFELIGSSKLNIDNLGEIFNKDLKFFYNSVVNLIEDSEKQADVRLTKVMISTSLPFFENQNYSLKLDVPKSFSFNNIDKYIDFRSFNFLVKNDYFLTNCFPYSYKVLEAGETSQKVEVNFILLSYSRYFLSSINDVLDNLSLSLEGIIFMPLILPFTTEVKNFDTVISITENYISFFKEDNIGFLQLGYSAIYENLDIYLKLGIKNIKKNLLDLKEIIGKENISSTNIFKFASSQMDYYLKRVVRSYYDRLHKTLLNKEIIKEGEKILIINNTPDFLNLSDIFDEIFNGLDYKINNYFDDRVLMQRQEYNDTIHLKFLENYYLRIDKDIGFLNFKKRLYKYLFN